MNSGLVLSEERELSSVSICPLGLGDNFPVQPMPGFIIVKAELDKVLNSRLVTRDQRARDFERATQNIKNPMKGVVMAIGQGEDIDPSDRRRKPLPTQDGDTVFELGDTVLFRPIGSYLLEEAELPQDDFFLMIGDREILGVKKAKGGVFALKGDA